MKRKRLKQKTPVPIEALLRKSATLEPVSTGADDVLAVRDFTLPSYELYVGKPTLYSHDSLLQYMLGTRQQCVPGRRTFIDADGRVLAIDWKMQRMLPHTIWYFDGEHAHLLEKCLEER